MTADDRLDIQGVAVLYGYVLDDRNWDAFSRVFTEDAVVDFSGGEPRQGLAPIVGLHEIIRLYRDVLIHPLQHMLVNHLLEEVSEDEVIVRSKALFPIPGGMAMEGIYRDRVVRTGEGWRIRHKSITSKANEPHPWLIESLERMRERGAPFL